MGILFESRHGRYTYKAIPYWANEVYTNKLGDGALGNKEWIMESAGKVAFSWDGFEAQNILASSYFCIILYIFPEPQKTPDAKFGILTISLDKKDYSSYYTLEKSENGIWFLGGIDIVKRTQDGELNHFNYGQVEYEPTLENFIHDVFIRLSVNRELSFLVYSQRCPNGHFYHKNKNECPHCIAYLQVKPQADNYRNALLDAHSTPYNMEELQKIIDTGMIDEYRYIYFKALRFLLTDEDEYRYNDYFRYPLSEWDKAKLKIGCEQWIQTKGITEQQYLEDLTQTEIRNLFELFHYNMLKVEPTTKKTVSKITFQHKFREEKCYVFCQLKF